MSLEILDPEETRMMRALIKRHEGAVRFHNGNHRPYQCPAGKWTLGIGRNIEERGISDEEAEHLLGNDLEYCRAELTNHVPGYPQLNAVRKAVLVDMCFNMGWTRLSSFKRMLAAVNGGYWAQASAEMVDSKWFQQVGSRGWRLAGMMETGVWPNDVAV